MPVPMPCSGPALHQVPGQSLLAARPASDKEYLDQSSERPEQVCEQSSQNCALSQRPAQCLTHTAVTQQILQLLVMQVPERRTQAMRVSSIREMH